MTTCNDDVVFLKIILWFGRLFTERKTSKSVLGAYDQVARNLVTDFDHLIIYKKYKGST